MTDEKIVGLLARDALSWAEQPRQAARDVIAVLRDAGYVVVPVEPTMEMLNAAIDVDAFRLGNISPLGFRESPQRLFERCYRAMIAAASHE